MSAPTPNRYHTPNDEDKRRSGIKDVTKGLLSRFAKLNLTNDRLSGKNQATENKSAPQTSQYRPTTNEDQGHTSYLRSPYKPTVSHNDLSLPPRHPANLLPGQGRMSNYTNDIQPVVMPHPSHYYSPPRNPLPKPPVLPHDFDQTMNTSFSNSTSSWHTAESSPPRVDMPDPSIHRYGAVVPPNIAPATSTYVLSMPSPVHYSSASLAPPPLRHSSSAPQEIGLPAHRTAASEPQVPTRSSNLSDNQPRPPSTPVRPRADSNPTSPTNTPSKDSGIVQCSGVTKANKRCTRQVKAPPPLGWLSPEDEMPRFCFQHSKELLSPTGFYSRQTRAWVDFDEWIPDHLSAETRVLLCVEMEKAVSSSDVEGYIYCFELRDPSNKDQVHLKVGRAINLVKRIDQWTKQCETKEPILRGWYPGPDDGTSLSEAPLMKGVVIAGKKGKHCHRLERLIHLELADLSMFSPYLKPGFVGGKQSKSSSSSGSPPPNTDPVTPKKKVQVARKPCPDCRAVHKEIFTFNKVKSGGLKGKEWEAVVHPVIEKWGEFVETYL